MKTLVAIALGFLFSAVLEPTVAKSPCVLENPSIIHNALEIRTIEMHMHPKTEFSWSAVKGTANITIYTSKDLKLSTKTKNRILLSIEAFGSSGTTLVPNCLHAVTGLLVLFFLIQNKIFVAVFIICLAAVSTVIAAGISCEKVSAIHINIPLEYVQTICQNGRCFPVLCKFISAHPDFSSIPSDNRLLFKDNLCNIKKPEGWDEWLEQYFGANSTQDYYGDYDGDGLINIMEYYGSKIFNESKRENVTRSRRALSFNAQGTNPTKADSDGDLLLDGFETYYQLDPITENDINDDYDSDLLSNLKEQILNTDPFNSDSDGDGVFDGLEVQRKANPRDPTDKGRIPVSEQTAEIRLTIGDPSGSHSERYILSVGGISHQSPDYGVVGSGTYTFKTGTYPVTIQHTGSILSTPDYDYTAQVSKVSGTAKVTIRDTDRILGPHYESTFFYAKGRSAQVVVEYDCSTSNSEDTSCQCRQLKTCSLCKTNSKCAWDAGIPLVGTKGCKDKDSWIWKSGRDRTLCM